MGHRLSKIYTRTGDDGSTGLGDGQRIRKDSLRVDAYGTVDELNSVVGMVLAGALAPDIRDCLVRVQHRLFDLGGELCMPGYEVLAERHVQEVEGVLDGFNANLPPLKEFILPGGNMSAAHCHLARTVCRRAERRVTTLAAEERINAWALKYLNRLSDLLFVLARVMARQEGGQEVLWQKDLG
jgi:cob(I)alamin adenosyltransferase